MEKIITEGKARIRVKDNSKVTWKMPVFYNPVMKLNRDISVLLLKSSVGSHLRIADPLAASGIRAIRFLKELEKSKVEGACVNDGSAAAAANIRDNLKLNKISSRKVVVSNEEANIFLLKNKPFDYIDIDPFGTPVTFLDSAVKSISRNGILAVTATDTAALSGTAPRACLRKYWAVPLKNHLMHELGLRILARRVQLEAASHEKALVPVYSYSMLHYMRIFFRCSNKNSDVDSILNHHSFISYCNNCLSVKIVSAAAAKNSCDGCKNKKIWIAGPLWGGRLWDAELAAAICKKNKDETNRNFLKTISEEAKIYSLGFYDTHVFSRKLGIQVPRLESVMDSLRKLGFMAARTHFSGNGIRTNASSSVFARIIRKLS